jgi:hypothetical protein
LGDDVGCFSTDLARRYGALDEGDFEKWSEEEEDAVVIIYAGSRQ